MFVKIETPIRYINDKYMDLTERSEEVMTKHQERLTGLKKLIRRGDWIEVADKLGVLPNTAQKAFDRTTSERHLEVVSVLEKVISARLEKFKVG